MILTVGNVKGGVGKSTLACNIASALSLVGAGDVLLIDGDKQGSSAIFAEARAENLGEAGFTCVRAQGSEVLSQVKTMCKKFAHIIIDAGGQDNPSLRAGLVASDKILVPIPPRSAEIWALDAMSTLIEEASFTNDRLKAYATINFAFPRGSDNRETTEIITEDFKVMRLIGQPIMQRKIWSDALGKGLSIMEAKPRNMDAINEFLSLLAGLGVNQNGMKVIYNGRTKEAKKQYS